MIRTFWVLCCTLLFAGGVAADTIGADSGGHSATGPPEVLANTVIDEKSIITNEAIAVGRVTTCVVACYNCEVARKATSTKGSTEPIINRNDHYAALGGSGSSLA